MYISQATYLTLPLVFLRTVAAKFCVTPTKLIPSTSTIWSLTCILWEKGKNYPQLVLLIICSHSQKMSWQNILFLRYSYWFKNLSPSSRSLSKVFIYLGAQTISFKKNFMNPRKEKALWNLDQWVFVFLGLLNLFLRLQNWSYKFSVL